MEATTAIAVLSFAATGCPWMRAMFCATASAVTGVPSENLASGFSWKVYVSPSADMSQAWASSGRN